MKAQTSSRALAFRILMALYLIAVATLCFVQINKIPDEVPKMIFGIPIDKVVHFCMFFPFPIIGFFSFDHSKWSVARTFGKILELAAYGCIFAGFTEFIQGMLPYRTEDIADFKADTLAICLASLLVFVIDIFFIKHSGRK